MRKVTIDNKLKDFFLILFILTIGVLFLFFFKIRHSMNFTNLDELLWMYRSRFFMDGILSFEFSNLIQSSQPGIMVMWAVGPFMKIINYDFNSILIFTKYLNESGVGYNIINSRDQSLFNNYKSISLLLNIPIFTIIFLFISSLYYLLKKLTFNRWAITFSLLLIVTTPYYIYFTTPTDKLVGSFSVLSILSLLVYSSCKGGKKFLIFSAVFGSWAALTKLSALLLVPFVLFILILYKFNFSIFYLVHISKVNLYANVKNIVNNYITWIIIFFLTCIIFLPTIISNPHSVISLIIKEESTRAITNNHSIFFIPTVIYTYLSDSFLFSFNLFIIFIFIVFLMLLFSQLKNKVQANKEILSLVIYFFSFFIFIAIFSSFYSFRHLVPILLIFQILAGIGIYELSIIFIKKYNIVKKTIIFLWIIVFILISQGLLIYNLEIIKIEDLPFWG